MILQELAQHTEGQFVSAFESMGVDAFLDMIKEDCGLDVKKLPRKVDTIKAAYAAIVEAAQNLAMPPTPDPVPSEDATPSDGGQVFLIRSRQPAGRWRAGRLWGKALVEVKESDFRPAEWDAINGDRVLDVRKKV